MFGMKFMAEALKGAGIITMGGATPVGMALDATLAGSITYAVGFTTVKYLEQDQDLSAAEMRREFRALFAEGKDRVRELASDAIETEEGGTGYSVLMEEMLLSDITEIQDCAVVAGRFHDRTVPVVVVTIGESEVAAEKLLTRANEVLQAAGHPRIAVLEIARTPEEFPVGVTGKVLKRQLREKYRQLADYLQQEDRILATAGLEMPETEITD